MLKKFVVLVKGDMSDLYLFQLGIERMEQNKKKYKKEFNYYNRMGNNWFPLVMLEKMSVAENSDINFKYQMIEQFSFLNSYSDFQSYYIDKYEKRGDTIRMLVKGRDAVMLEEMLKRVVCFYDLQCTYREKGVNKEEPQKDKKNKENPNK